MQQKEAGTITTSAYSQARSKLSHTAFIELNNDTVNTYYKESQHIKTFFGFRCIGVDRSDIILPNEKDIKNEFGYKKIKNGTGKDLGDCVYGECLCYYDVLNKIALKTSLSHGKNYEVTTALSMLEEGNENDLYILDRAYASYQMFATLITQDKNFIIRVPKNRFKVADNMFKNLGSWSQEAIIKIPKNQRKALSQYNLPEEIKIRFVKVILSTGEVEILATSIMRKDIGQEDFKALYWLSTGKTVESIKQDFWSSVLISNLESILTEDTNDIFQTKSIKNKLPQQVNRAVSFNAIKNSAFELFYSEDSTEIIMSKLQQLFMLNPVTIRVNKTKTRYTISPIKSLNFQKRQRKVVF